MDEKKKRRRWTGEAFEARNRLSVPAKTANLLAERYSNKISIARKRVEATAVGAFPWEKFNEALAAEIYGREEESQLQALDGIPPEVLRKKLEALEAES